jgi:kynurenine/2-aminoadipate aminotransferase
MAIQLKDGPTLQVPQDRMERALQYSATAGLPELVQWLKGLQHMSHGQNPDAFDVCVGNGSQEVLTKAFEMLVDDGDTILIEAPAYSGTLAFLRPLGCKFAGIFKTFKD